MRRSKAINSNWPISTLSVPPDFQYVPLTDIALSDDTLKVTYHPEMQALAQSVAQAGVLTPLHLRRVTDAGGLQVVCGFKRLQACLGNGLQRIPALLYDSSVLSDEQAFLLAVYDNLGCRVLNAVEKGRILRRLQDTFHYEAPRLIEEWCPRLDLPRRADTLEAYGTLVTLDDALQRAVVEGSLPLETALWIGHHAAADRPTLLALFTGLKLGYNRARECATLIEELCHRDACRPVTLLQRLDIPALLAEPQLAAPQKVERLRQALQAARHPLLSQHEQRFQDLVRHLRLPSPVQLRHPPYFEGQQFQVGFAFHSRQDLQRVAQGLLDAAGKEALDDLLALL